MSANGSESSAGRNLYLYLYKIDTIGILLNNNSINSEDIAKLILYFDFRLCGHDASIQHVVKEE